MSNHESEYLKSILCTSCIQRIPENNFTIKNALYMCYDCCVVNRKTSHCYDLEGAKECSCCDRHMSGFGTKSVYVNGKNKLCSCNCRYQIRRLARNYTKNKDQDITKNKNKNIILIQLKDELMSRSKLTSEEEKLIEVLNSCI